MAEAIIRAGGASPSCRCRRPHRHLSSPGASLVFRTACRRAAGRVRRRRGGGSSWRPPARSRQALPQALDPRVVVLGDLRAARPAQGHRQVSAAVEALLGDAVVHCEQPEEHAVRRAAGGCRRSGGAPAASGRRRRSHISQRLRAAEDRRVEQSGPAVGELLGGADRDIGEGWRRHAAHRVRNRRPGQELSTGAQRCGMPPGPWSAGTSSPASDRPGRRAVAERRTAERLAGRAAVSQSDVSGPSGMICVGLMSLWTT